MKQTYISGDLHASGIVQFAELGDGCMSITGNRPKIRNDYTCPVVIFEEGSLSGFAKHQ